jgi:orotidine-5'-phosphate decarboxylase
MKIIGVTVLTSLDDSDMRDVGFAASRGDQVVRLARLAESAGLDGVVCSAHDLAAVRKACRRDFLTIVPGIRPAGSDMGDQKRVMTPTEAVTAGADIIVIARPIIAAPDPAEAARAIAASLP